MRAARPAISINENIEIHDELNTKLFENNTLKQEVKDKINAIVDTFISNLSEDNIKIDVEDIILVGSNVSYNYTDNSDLDIHIIANTDTLDCSEEIYNKLYGAYRSIFNLNMNIDFYGIPVEIYVETDDTPLRSNGIYSVKDDEWLKEPDREDIPEIDENEIDAQVKPFIDRYNTIEENPSTDQIDSLMEDIYEVRKQGMSKEDGEYSIENLTFKEFRNRGYLDKLKDLRNDTLSSELSLRKDESLSFCEEYENNIYRKLSNSEIYALKLELSKIAKTQVQVFPNKRFTIENVRESDADVIIRKLKMSDKVEEVHKIESGKYDFGHYDFKKSATPKKYFIVNGKLSDLA